jgi:predicted TIM-barrel fold metal-dependent hydrolase
MGTPLGVFGPFAGHGHTVADRDQTLRQWQDSISRIAQYRNVTVKLSGMFMPVLGWGLHLKKEAATRSEIVERLAPLVDFVIGQFGAERCMFASNFPIDKPSISLVDLYQVYHEIVANRSPQERESLFSGTARRVYRIKE